MTSPARWTYQMLQHPTQRKHVFRWRRSLATDYFLRKKQPWLAFDAIDFLASFPLKGKQVFEYGSGGSTLYWCKRGAHVTSVEHDESWYCKVREEHFNAASLDYRLILPQLTEDENLDYADPDAYASADEAFAKYSFQRYCSQIDEFPDQFFDLVLVDGRARPACIKHAAQKVKVGGILVLDNSDRDYYLQRTAAFLAGYERKTFAGVTPAVTWFSETSIFIRRA